MSRPKKSLGQNFLTDPATAEKVTEAGGIAEDSFVLEVGPGRGFLTRRLLETGAQVLAVEKDAALARELSSSLAVPNLEVVCADFLTFDLGQFRQPAIAVGNLPYNVAMPILMRTLAHAHLFKCMVFMFQLEVAQRICARPGSRKYGVPSVLTALTHQARIVRRIPPGAFFPKPKVHSALVLFEPEQESAPLSPEERSEFADFVGAVFRFRRKKAANAMGRVTGQAPSIFSGLLADNRLHPDVRPERIPVHILVRLWRQAAHLHNGPR